MTTQIGLTVDWAHALHKIIRILEDVDLLAL